MRRPGRFVAWLTAAILVGWGLSWALPRVPRRLAEIDWFRVRAVRVEGAKNLSAEEVERLAAVSPSANLWDDAEPVAARVRAHPLVREVAVSRRLPATLLIRLPLDPARLRLDLPVLRPARAGAAASTPAALAPAAREIARLAEAEPTLWANVSVVTAEGARDLMLDLSEPAVRMHVRIPLTPLRLREALAVLDDATGRTGEPPATLDLRFADQVVIRRGESH